MKYTIVFALFISFFQFSPFSCVSGQSLKLPLLFGDNMILQQNDSVAIWGWSEREDNITIISSWGDTVFTRADNGARWNTRIKTPAGSYNTHHLTIVGKDPSDIVLIKNILIGEVWLASGQSNMYWSSKRLQIPNLQEEIGKADFPEIRVFNVSLRASETPQDDLDGTWKVCSPDVMQNTSGAAYFFAKQLHQNLGVPVGIIVDAWGGTPIEFWYPLKAFEDDPELIVSADKLKEFRKWPTSVPGTGYNAMTYPLKNFTISGMIWYQGEANVFDPLTYSRKMKVLVSERRKQFGQDLPVYFVQIAPYKYTNGNSGVLRDQQRLSLNIPNTGMVVCSDIGDTTNIHPRNKPELGKRLANLALKHHYNKNDDLVESPIYKSAVLYKGKVYVSFHYADSLHFKGPEKGYFEVAGPDGEYKIVDAQIEDNFVLLDTRKIANPVKVRFAFSNTATPVLFNKADLPASCFAPQTIKRAASIHAVTDLSHEFTFYSDHRFHQQYLPEEKGVTNWCNLYNFDFSNANLLILPGCDNRISYLPEDITAIQSFIKSGGGVLIMGHEESLAQNLLIKHFGANFTGQAELPLSCSRSLPQLLIEAESGSVLSFDNKRDWEVLIMDAAEKALMARRKIGKGKLLVASRSLAGSHPSAKDSINTDLWKPILADLSSGKKINPFGTFNSAGIDNLEYNDNHGTFKLSYNDYLKPFADQMVDIYKRSMPFVEKRMGVPLSPGMASQVTLLATGGGGFSSGTVVALAVWWGGFPEKEDGMIEFLTHEAVHSWVLPFAEVWNEPIATYVGNLVMMDMGHEEEALRRIKKTIERASRLDPDMKNYDLRGNLTGVGEELNRADKNNIHWGKTYWILEQLREENPYILSDYFKLKRKMANPDEISEYGINETVELLSRAIGRDLFKWFNEIGIPAKKEEAKI